MKENFLTRSAVPKWKGLSPGGPRVHRTGLKQRPDSTAKDAWRQLTYQARGGGMGGGICQVSTGGLACHHPTPRPQIDINCALDISDGMASKTTTTKKANLKLLNMPNLH